MDEEEASFVDDLTDQNYIPYIDRYSSLFEMSSAFTTYSPSLLVFPSMNYYIIVINVKREVILFL